MSATPETTSPHQLPPDWYADPQKEAPYRYWNGERWTSRTRDTTPISRGIVAALIACALAVIGAFGPWATIGILHVAGTDGQNDGRYTLAAGVIAAIAVGLYMRSRNGLWRGLVMLIALGLIAAGIADISDVSSRHASFFGTDISPSVGWGLWLTPVSGALMLLSTFWMPKPIS